MKKYISILLSIILTFSIFVVYAENEDEASMSVEVFTENQDAMDNASETEISNSFDNFQDEIIDLSEIISMDDENELYEVSPLSEDTWSKAAELLEGRADFETLIINGDLYVIGGFGDNGYIYSIDKFSESTLSWETVTTIPNEINGFSVVDIGDNIYIIGGYIDNKYLKDIQIYNTSSGTWETGTPMLERRDKATALYADNKIYVFGGRNAKGIVNSYEYYDPISNTWSKVTSDYDETLIRVGAKGKYVDGYVCIYGGYNKQCENMGVNLYQASDMGNMIKMTDKGSEYISLAWGVDKAFVFSTNTADASTYKVEEMVVNEDKQTITDVQLNDYPINACYTQNVIYNGYLYSIGGYQPTTKSYLKDMYKYSVNFGDLVSGDGSINSVVTADGNIITLNVETDKNYYFMINVNNMSTFAGYTFTIEYPEDGFNLIDACALTDNKDTLEGLVKNTDIRITEKSDRRLSFTCSETIPTGKKISETVNVICLKAKSSGQRTIKYQMTK